MFSTKLEAKLQSGNVKTIGDLKHAFGEKSFAILFLLLMFIPSLPIPTGGITHLVLLPIVWIASMEMIFGRRSLWFPWFINRVQLGDNILHKGLPFMIRRIRWFEKFSRPRLSASFGHAGMRTLSGTLIFLLALAAFIAPPFSGLDTLPSMGAVIIALAIILEDIALYIIGVLVGAIGIGLIVAAAGLVSTFIHRIF